MKAWIIVALVAVAASPVDPGRKIYTCKCARCHKLYDPANYDGQTWDKWMQKMKQKSKLTDDQYRQFSEYIASLQKKK
jgi:cytochrome c5